MHTYYQGPIRKVIYTYKVAGANSAARLVTVLFFIILISLILFISWWKPFYITEYETVQLCHYRQIFIVDLDVQFLYNCAEARLLFFLILISIVNNAGEETIEYKLIIRRLGELTQDISVLGPALLLCKICAPLSRQCAQTVDFYHALKTASPFPSHTPSLSQPSTISLAPMAQPPLAPPTPYSLPAHQHAPYHDKPLPQITGPQQGGWWLHLLWLPTQYGEWRWCLLWLPACHYDWCTKRDYLMSMWDQAQNMWDINTLSCGTAGS